MRINRVFHNNTLAKVIGTFTQEDKDRYKDTPEKVPCGIPGLASLFTSLHENLMHKESLSLDKLVGLCCIHSAKMMNIDMEAKLTLNALLGLEKE